MMRWKWFMAIGALTVVVLITAVYAYLNAYDYNKLKPRIARMVKDATGRKLDLAGEVDLAIGFSPALVVRDVTLANASWASQPKMLKIDELRAQVRLLPLLFRDVELKNIGFKGVDVALETNPDGVGNWEFAVDQSPIQRARTLKATEINIDNIRIENLNLTLHDGKTKSAKRINLIDLKATRQTTADELTIDLKANYKGQQLTFSGKTGLVSAAMASKRFPLELSGAFSNATIKIEGSLDNVLELKGIDIKVQTSGENLAKLKLTDYIQLPKTNAFDITGHLKGSKESLALNDVSGNLFVSDINLSFSGSVGDMVALSGIDLKLDGSGRDLSEIGPIIGQKLPATDKFALKGQMTGSTKILSLREAHGYAYHGDLSLAVDGGIEDLLHFDGVDLVVKGSGKDLSEVGRIIDEKLPATDAFTVEGRLGGSAKSLSLQQAQGSAHRGSLNLTLNGGIEELPALNGINFSVKASGKELAEIGPLVGAELPELGPFDVSGKLSGSAKAIALEDFLALVDKSDFNGMAKLEFLKRPKITVRLESSVIDFTALMKSLEKYSQKPAKKDKQKRRLFSDDPLPFDVLRKVDADIVIKARNIHAKDAQLEFGHLTLKLENIDLSIDRLEATYKKTKISANLHIDPGSPPQVAAHFLVQSFNLGDFLKETEKSDQVRAIVDIAAHGKSRGDSVSGLMANLDGSIGAVMGEGYLTKYLNLLSVNLSQKVISFWGHHEQADQIQCAVVQFDIEKGIADSQAFVFDTQAGILTGEGEINLGTEQINFLLVPKPEHPSLSLSTKLRVSGTVMEPKVRPDAVSLLTGGVKLLSTLAVGPIGLLAPFVHLGANKKHPCDVGSTGQLGINIPGDN
jgi:uncharacterized protein involved in outer membrane biogenesis